MAAYRMTPARRRALQKAQAASARKRRGKGKGKLAAANRKNKRLKRAMAYTVIGAGGAVALGVGGVGAIATHQIKHASSSRYRNNYDTIRSAPRRAMRRRQKRR